MSSTARAFTLRDFLMGRGSRKEAAGKSQIYDPILDPGLSLESPDLREVLDHYRALRPGKDLPVWRAFSPTQLAPHLLPHLLVLDVDHASPLDYRWRLIGTGIVETVDRDPTGSTFAQLYGGDTLRRMLIAPQWILAHREPLRSRSCGAYAGAIFRPSENLFLPFVDEEGAIRRILFAIIYDPIEEEG